MIPALLYLALAIAYGLFIVWILQGLRRTRRPWSGETVKKVSVIIAARNEEQNISFSLGTLLKQSHPRASLEIIVVDDHSSDRTRSVAETIAAKFSMIRVLAAPSYSSSIAPKKAALAAGIRAATGEIILTLDADCAAPSSWVEKMSALFADDITAAASWVLIPEEKSLPTQIEFLDALALQLIGAAAIGWGKPLLANGANLAFRRCTFQKIGGYEGFAYMGSGDDDLLLQKLHARGDGRILFNTDPESAVTTLPCKSWQDFFQQRIRWSSKAAFYPAWVKAIEGVAFVHYVALLLGIPLALFLSFPLWVPILTLLCKMGCDYLLLRKGVRMVRRSWSWPGFLGASLLHIAYIPVIGLIGQFGRFEWKGRTYRQGRLEKSAAMKRV